MIGVPIATFVSVTIILGPLLYPGVSIIDPYVDPLKWICLDVSSLIYNPLISISFFSLVRFFKFLFFCIVFIYFSSRIIAVLLYLPFFIQSASDLLTITDSSISVTYLLTSSYSLALIFFKSDSVLSSVRLFYLPSSYFWLK